VFALMKHGRGLDFPDDFAVPRTGEQWYQHDRLVKHNYRNVGLGLDWALGERHVLSASWMTMKHAESIHILDAAIDITVTRSF
jgi:hypothetical protein